MLSALQLNWTQIIHALPPFSAEHILMPQRLLLRITQYRCLSRYSICSHVTSWHSTAVIKFKLNILPCLD